MEVDMHKHITIQKGNFLPGVKRCTTCCRNYHCLFCSPDHFKPAKPCKLKTHLEGHFHRAVIYEGYTIHRCALGCRENLHFHCMYCKLTILFRNDFIKHLVLCKTNRNHNILEPQDSTTMPASTSAGPQFVPPTPTLQLSSAISGTDMEFTVPTIPATPITPATSVLTAPTIPATPITPATSVLTAPTIPATPITPATSVLTAPTIPATPITPATSVLTAPTILATPIKRENTILTTAAESVPLHGFSQNVKSVTKKSCHICKVIMNKNNIKRHIERKHLSKCKDITSTSHLNSECIDPENGIYSVKKSFLGPSNPLHVQNKVWGENLNVACGSTECQVNTEQALRSGLKAFQCIHLKSIAYCNSYISTPILNEDILNDMVKRKWFGEDIKKLCLERKKNALINHKPLSVETKIGTPQTKKIISVYEPTVSYYSQLGRVFVSYDTKKNSWHCACEKTKRSCIHKYIAKWHLFDTERDLFKKDQSSDESKFPPTAQMDSEAVNEEADVEDLSYPPKDQAKLTNIVQYLLKYKKIPSALPEDLRLPSAGKEYERHLIPVEMFCKHCSGSAPLSDPILITNTAKILTNTHIVKDVFTYYKVCLQCGTHYRYQEWKDGLHNFNDRIILSIHLCLTIRNLLQVHTAVSRVVEFLELNTGVKFPSADVVLHGYLHFEALCDHDYRYSCVTCGDHPPVVILDLHKKGAFHLSMSDLPQPADDFKGEVDMDHFWEALTMERVGRGFVSSHKSNPFAIAPSYHFWAPWIGNKTRRSNCVLNTEHEKVHKPKASKVLDVTVTEDRLRDELFKQKVEVIRALSRECGLDSSGSRTDLLLQISNEMKSRETYDKVFEKIWAASGGWAVIMCPCGIVYSLKCNIRAESPRDFADLLLSWTHLPNIIIYDFAGGLAAHLNLRDPERLPCTPYEGRLAEPTEQNIALAKAGKLRVSLPWLIVKKQVPDINGHPGTGSSEHYALYDRFHEDNSTKDPRDALRKLGLIPQLAGKFNSQVAEQFLLKMKKNNYFLNMALPSTHLFLMRNIIHHYNVNKQDGISVHTLAPS